MAEEDEARNPEEMRFGGIRVQFSQSEERSEQAEKATEGKEETLEEILAKAKSLEGILKAVNAANKIPGGEAMLKAIVSGGYNATAGKYRPLLRLLPTILELMDEDLVAMVVPAYKALNDLAENEDIAVESDRNRKIRAGKRKKTLDAYVAAGFTKEQAFDLLVLDLTRGAGSGVSPLITGMEKLAPVAKAASAKARTTKK